MKKLFILLLSVLVLSVIGYGVYHIYNLNKKIADYKFENQNLNTKLDSEKKGYDNLAQDLRKEREFFDTLSSYCKYDLENPVAVEGVFQYLFSFDELKDVLKIGKVKQLCFQPYGAYQIHFVIGGEFSGFNTIIGRAQTVDGSGPSDIQLAKFTYPARFPEDGGKCRVIGDDIIGNLLYNCSFSGDNGSESEVGYIRDGDAERQILRSCTYNSKKDDGVKCKIDLLK